MTTIQETKDAMLSGRLFCLTPGWLGLITEAVLEAAKPDLSNLDYVQTANKIGDAVVTMLYARCRNGHVRGCLSRNVDLSSLIAYYV